MRVYVSYGCNATERILVEFNEIFQGISMLVSKNKIAMTKVYVSLLFSIWPGSMLVTFFVICIMQFIVCHYKIDL